MKRSKFSLILYILYVIACLVVAIILIVNIVKHDTKIPFLADFSSSIQNRGTYYLVRGENNVDRDVYFTLDKGKWTDANGFSGSYKISNGEITLYTGNNDMTFASGSIGGGRMDLKFSESIKHTYVKQ